MRVLGIMSGTSMDGVDYALCEITRRRCELLELWSVEYPRSLRLRVMRCAANEASSHELAQLHHDLGRFYAAHMRGDPKSGNPCLVGLHGQTVFHQPRKGRAATLQIGDPSWLVARANVPVVSNFRSADLAFGGQGAPLATAFHVRVFGGPGRHVCVQNLGGIGNVTSIFDRDAPDRRSARVRQFNPQVLSFDTGPANVLMDLAASHFSRGRRSFDRDGRMAAQGSPSEHLLGQWLRHPFFRKPPPKSTGREMFGEAFFQSILTAIQRHRLAAAHVLATLAEFTARSMVLNYRWHLPQMPDSVIVCGGGGANPSLMHAMRLHLGEAKPGLKVQTCEELGWPLKSVEPAAFALLAWMRWHRLPGNLPQTTGASARALLGGITE